MKIRKNYSPMSEGCTEIIADDDAGSSDVIIEVEESFSEDGGNEIFLSMENVAGTEVYAWLSARETDALVAAINLARRAAKERRA